MRKKTVSAVIVILVGALLWGCGGVEPEKREYPQVIAVDRSGNENVVFFGMPNMQETTGQEKPEGGNQDATLKFTGKDMAEIRRKYNETQEKYLDLSHVEVLILGDTLIGEGLWEQVLSEMKSDNSFGEDIYVFAAEDVAEIMKYNGTKTDALGDFLIGIYENRPYHMKKKGVTLREVYKVWYESGTLPALPGLVQSGEDDIRIAE